MSSVGNTVYLFQPKFPLTLLELLFAHADIIHRVIRRDDDVKFRPRLAALGTVPKFVTDCIQDCWAEEVILRPDFKTIRNKLKPLQKGMYVQLYSSSSSSSSSSFSTSTSSSSSSFFFFCFFLFFSVPCFFLRSSSSLLFFLVFCSFILLYFFPLLSFTILVFFTFTTTTSTFNTTTSSS